MRRSFADMGTFFETLRDRNSTLFYFGLVCLAVAAVCFVLSRVTTTEVHHVNAWLKPLKFALSIAVYSWTMGWYCHYLTGFNLGVFNWTVVALWGFELLYIAYRASRGELSHFNQTSSWTSTLYVLMAVAATVVTLYTAYVGVLFFRQDFPELPVQYVWGIRLGILVFVVFSLQGFAMGARLSHSVGAVNDSSNLFIVGWSRTFGDLRVAHFIGMHALQVLPLLSYYVLKSTRWTVVLSVAYGALAAIALFQALQGRPLFPQHTNPSAPTQPNA